MFDGWRQVISYIRFEIIESKLTEYPCTWNNSYVTELKASEALWRNHCNSTDPAARIGTPRGCWTCSGRRSGITRCSSSWWTKYFHNASGNLLWSSQQISQPRNLSRASCVPHSLFFSPYLLPYSLLKKRALSTKGPWTEQKKWENISLSSTDYERDFVKLWDCGINKYRLFGNLKPLGYAK